MSTRRERVPGLDALIPRAAPQQPAAGPKNTKTTLYLPPDVIGAMDRFRLDLRADRAIILDRSALIAAMWEYVADQPEFGDWIGTR